MTGREWTAQDPGSLRRAKTGSGVQAETEHVGKLSRDLGIAPSFRSVVCLPRRSMCAFSKGICVRGRKRSLLFR